MTELILSVEKLSNGDEILSHQTIRIQQGKIVSITAGKPDRNQYLKGLLTAGFIDVQVNGGGGFLFNHSPDLVTLEKIFLAHNQYGTTGWLPTLVTDSLQKMEAAANAVAAARAKQLYGVLGIHFEGPHLSVAKKGIHQQHYIREFSAAEEAIFSRQDLGKVVVTLAPETVSTAQISRLVKAGVIVSIGHSNASFEQTQQSLKAGATGFTHLFNAMSQFNSRQPGVVGAALMSKSSYSGMIMDGHHLHPAAAQLALNSQTNLMLVTDAMPVVGSTLKEFEFFGETIKKSGSELRDCNGKLAGSVLDMATAVKNSIEMLQLPQIEVLNLASRNPSRFLGIESLYGNIEVGKYANLLLLSDSGEVISCWVEGKKQV